MSKYQEDSEVAVAEIEKTIDTYQLIVHNDEVNTFDWVIAALIAVCKHNYEQAEQCAVLVHTRGKYAVKEGSMKQLKPLKDAISERGINATIE
ncbi:MAG: ATP-dependent Clp protease adaptor ClpS [Chitinophagales bacterium]|jgi:ATP-dependent Clp protease adaptor protein ClpS|nr:ATP-dependent Clp protease adaptor ClpS [Chitinophagales bacterium]|tara:strand:+ start:1127 stop:1405 length:279 start_codon:yes stop_codon:yes gene_type:complete